MKSLKFLTSPEVPIMCHPNRSQNIGITQWKRTRHKFLVPKILHRFLSMQRKVLKILHNTPCSSEVVRYNHLKASSKEPSAAQIILSSSSSSNTVQPTTHAEMIKTYFGISRSTAYRIMEKDNRLKNCDVHILARNMNTLQENSVNTEEVRNHMALLSRCPLTIEHNIAVMKELGLKKLRAEHFADFNRFFKARVAMIKRWGFLSEHYDPVEILALLGIPDEVSHDVKLYDINNLTLGELHWKLSRMCLSWRLDCTNEEINNIGQTYRLTKKSMRLQWEVLDQLINEWNMNILQIRQNGYLLTCSPVNMALINREVKQIVGIDIKECASLAPRILCTPYHLLLEVDNILSQLPISTASVKALPRICTLHPETLKERIKYLQQSAEFSALQSHPRVLHLIYYHTKITSRLNLLQQVKKSNVVPSLNKLSGPQKDFSKYMNVGDLRNNKRDIVMCLSQSLSVQPTIIRKCLHLHCWGPQTTLVNVQRNISVLGEAGFTTEQLLAGLDVVLYPPDLVKDQLLQLPNRPQVQPFSNFKSKVNVLQHLLYYMEKNTSLTSIE